jgi:hypothetical protein
VHEIVERQRELSIYVPADRKPEFSYVDLIGNESPVPSHIKLVVRSEDSPIEHLRRSFE